MSGSPSSTLRFAEKRELILDGAARLFNRRGIKAGTLSEVAASVGLATNKPAEFIVISISQDTRALEAELAGGNP